MLKYKYLPLCILVLFYIVSCRNVKENYNDKSNDLANAIWITDSRDLPDTESLLYDDQPAPLFRKEFIVKEGFKTAKLYISAAGYYVAGINGNRIGDNYLDPAWTNYRKRVYYSEYDITHSLLSGKNCLGVTIGNGFYNPLPMKMWGKRNLRLKLPTGKPAFISKLKIIYANGTSEEIITDHSWKHSYGPITKNNVYLGDVYDARKEVSGWNLPGFNDTDWIESVENQGPGGQLQKAFFPAVQITKTINPVSIIPRQNNKYIADMGENFTGIYRINLKGKEGDTIIFRFGERLHENGELNTMTAVAGQIKRKGMGGIGSPDTAWQTDKYIFGKNGNIWYSPEFTFHVYRYMEISGLHYTPELNDIKGLALNTNVKKTGSFNCSSDIISSIQDATERTFLANLISVQSDCPGREKFGYGGDLNATSEAFIYNFDMQDFYRKTVYDWIDAMNDTAFIDTAPYVGIEYCGLSWESAFLITQYMLYLYYNDLELIKELYQLNLKWMEKAERIHPGGLVDKGLGDHESLEKVPVELIGTSHYLQCARIMKLFANLLNDGKNKKKFAALESKLQNILLKMFWEQPVKAPMNKQTLFSTLLYYKILPEDQEKYAVDSLFNELKKAPSGHFTTGIFGTKYIMEVLSEKGYTDSVFNIINSELYPGWGYMINKGATTIWETWKESDNVYSNCHPMFGSVSEWFFRWLGGIRPYPDHPGFKKFIINPQIPSGLDSINCTYTIPEGKIISKWINYGNNKRIFEIQIPEKSQALAQLPAKKDQKIKITDQSRKKSPSYKRLNDENIQLNLKPGFYLIEVSNN